MLFEKSYVRRNAPYQALFPCFAAPLHDNCDNTVEWGGALQLGKASCSRRTIKRALPLEHTIIIPQTFKPLNMQTKLTLTNLLASWIVFSHVLSNAIAFNPGGDPNHLFGELSSPIFNSRLANHFSKNPFYTRLMRKQPRMLSCRLHLPARQVRTNATASKPHSTTTNRRRP